MMVTIWNVMYIIRFLQRALMEKQFASITTEPQILAASGTAQALRSMHDPS